MGSGSKIEFGGVRPVWGGCEANASVLSFLLLVSSACDANSQDDRCVIHAFE